MYFLYFRIFPGQWAAGPKRPFTAFGNNLFFNLMNNFFEWIKLVSKRYSIFEWIIQIYHPGLSISDSCWRLFTVQRLPSALLHSVSLFLWYLGDGTDKGCQPPPDPHFFWTFFKRGGSNPCSKNMLQILYDYKGLLAT